MQLVYQKLHLEVTISHLLVADFDSLFISYTVASKSPSSTSTTVFGGYSFPDLVLRVQVVYLQLHLEVTIPTTCFCLQTLKVCLSIIE